MNGMKRERLEFHLCLSIEECLSKLLSIWRPTLINFGESSDGERKRKQLRRGNREEEISFNWFLSELLNISYHADQTRVTFTFIMSENIRSGVRRVHLKNRRVHLKNRRVHLAWPTL